MADVLVPRPAATVLVVREVPRLEVLMLKRNLNSDFVGGAYVFPGGRLEEADVRLGDWVLGPSDQEASARLGLDRGGLAYYAAALRETFEEAGLLFVVARDGSALELGEAREELVVWREALNAGASSMTEMLRAYDWRLDARAMEYLAHWVTPVGPPRRYDTRFFVVPAPPDQLAVHDDAEVVETRWMVPAEALAAEAAGDFEMIFPTIRTLQEIAGFASLGELVAFAASRSPRRRAPRMLQRDGDVVIELDEDD